MQATEGVNFENPSDIFAKLFAAIPHVIATAKKKGATDEMLNEMIAVTGMANETNRLVEGYQVEVDDFMK